MYIFFIFEHNTIIKLIIVERRVLIDIFLFINIRAKIYNSIFILLYVGDKNILCVCKLYLF